MIDSTPPEKVFQSISHLGKNLPCDKLRDHAFTGDGPPHFVSLLLVQDFAVQFALRFNAQHPEGGGHVKALGDGDGAKVYEEGHTPDREPI